MSNYICIQNHSRVNSRSQLIPHFVGEEISQLSYLQLNFQERDKYEKIPCPTLNTRTEDDLKGIFQREWDEDKNIL